MINIVSSGALNSTHTFTLHAVYIAFNVEVSLKMYDWLINWLIDVKQCLLKWFCLTCCNLFDHFASRNANYWSTSRPIWVNEGTSIVVRREVQCGQQTKRHWTKTAHCTQIHVHTLWYGYMLGVGPTEGLSSRWPRNQTYLIATIHNNLLKAFAQFVMRGIMWIDWNTHLLHIVNRCYCYCML